MKPYPAYKPTGLAWLPQIPEGWEVKRLKTVATKIYKGKGITKDEVVSGGNCSCVRYGEIYTKYQVSFRQCFSKTNLNEVGVPAYFYKGDLLFAGTGERIDEIGKCIAYLGDEKCMAGGDIIITKHNENPLFMSFAVNSPYAQYQKSQGKIKLKVVHISASEIGNLVVALPPLAEQERIAAYLDGVCAKVGKLVSAKKRQIELLKEAKQSLVTRAVTRGLDASVPLHDSGIDWIGEVPQHWEMPHLSSLTTKIGSGKTPKGGAAIYTNHGVMFIRSQNVYFDGLRTEDISYITDEIDSTMPSSRVQKDDVLFNITGGSIGRGCVFSTDDRANVNQHVCIIRCRQNRILPQYLVNVLFSNVGQESMRRCQNEGNRESLTFVQIGGFSIPLPPLAEQREIAAYLDSKCAAMDGLVRKFEQQIELLEEYKSSVISSVVTGQIDIRDVKMEEA